VSVSYTRTRRRRHGTRCPRVGAVTTVLALLLSLSAAPAHAGSYDVYACGGPAGPAQNAFRAAADTLMSAYSICPPQSAVGTGIATKVTSSGGLAPYSAGAYQIFDAPPGASVEYVDFNVGAIRLSNYWSVGIVAYGSAFDPGIQPYGCYAGLPGCGFGTPVFAPAVRVPLYNQAHFRFETRCWNAAGCDASASGFTPGNRALFSAANVVVRVDDWTTPAVVPHHGALWNSGWHRGYEEAWSTYTDNVGIMITRLYVDGVQRDVQDYRDSSWPQWVHCDFTRPRPCVDVDPGALAVDTATLADGRHEVRVEAVDAAGNVGAVERPIDVDNAAPVKPAGIAVEGGEEWRSTNGYTVRWTNPGGQVSPIAKAHYSICGSDANAGCSEGTVAADRIDGFTGLSLPRPGDYMLRVWLEDAAGNGDPNRVSDLVHLRFDDEAPELAFDEMSASDPTRISAHASDRISGLAGGEIELRKRGTTAWQPLDTRSQGDRLIAHVNDEELPDGIYELRAHAVDRAGNERSTQLRAGGQAMEITLPVRVRTNLRAGVPKRSKQTGVRLLGRAHVPFGQRVRVSGQLVDAGGAPIADAEVLVLQMPHLDGSRFSPLASLRTSAGGRFSYIAAPGPSRTLLLRYPGTSTVRPATREVTLLVAASSTIGVSQHFALNGETVTFSGRLRGGSVPAGGKLVELQARVRGRWRTFATTEADGRGAWSYDYRFDGTRGRQVYSFRARVPHEGTYPYEIGRSRRVRVTVVGL
jgi:hypothetical protein